MRIDSFSRSGNPGRAGDAKVRIMGIWTDTVTGMPGLQETAERAYVKYLDGGCSSPVAAFAEVDGDEIFIRGLYYSEATGKWLTGQIRGDSRGWREAWNRSCKAIEI